MPFTKDGEYIEWVEERPFKVPSLQVTIDLNSESQVAQIFGDISEELELAVGNPEKRSALLSDKARLVKKVGKNGKQKEEGVKSKKSSNCKPECILREDGGTFEDVCSGERDQTQEGS